MPVFEEEGFSTTTNITLCAIGIISFVLSIIVISDHCVNKTKQRELFAREQQLRHARLQRQEEVMQMQRDQNSDDDDDNPAAVE